MDKNKIFGEKNFFEELAMGAPWKKYGQRMTNFERFFDIIDNHTCVHMHIEKNFKICHHLAKFLNYLKGPSVDFFKILNFELPHVCVE